MTPINAFIISILLCIDFFFLPAVGLVSSLSFSRFQLVAHSNGRTWPKPTDNFKQNFSVI